ncbi:MAG: thermonuclease family protein [Thiomicrorhabdus sp.]|jgi:micrococcal nuclease|nr:thermonuclease family protein [Thiomicrorhabdus sp.]
MRNILFIFLSLIFTAPAYAVKCEVYKVSDGDTIKVTCNGRKVKIRLYGVDTPETKQRYGLEATQYTTQAVLNKTVDIRVIDIDRYGRSVAIVQQGDFNLNEMLVRTGQAWVYDKYCKESFCADFKQYEKQARQQRIGLWEDNTPKAPWNYRKALRGGSSASSNKSQVTHSGDYHGNIRSHVFHGSSCRHYNCKNCTKPFSSKSQAVGAGYKPHNQCVN